MSTGSILREETTKDDDNYRAVARKLTQEEKGLQKYQSCASVTKCVAFQLLLRPLSLSLSLKPE